MAQGSMTPAPSDGTMVLDDDHGPRTPCPFPGCKAWSHLGTPFCYQHLREVGFTAGKKTSRPATATKSAKQPPVPGTRNGAAVLRSPFLRRKTAPSVHRPIVSPKSARMDFSASPAMPPPPSSTAQSDDSMESRDFLRQRYPTTESSEGADRSMTSERSVLDRSSSSHGGVAGHGELTGQKEAAAALASKDGREEEEEEEEEENAEQRKRASPAGEHSHTEDTTHGSLLVSSMPQRTSPPLYGGIVDIRELRARRRRPVPPYNLDAYVYNQDGVGMAAPEDVIIPTKADMATSRTKSAAKVAAAMTTAAMMTATPTSTTSPFPMQPQYLYANMDPRIHWMRPRSNSWHAAKQAEIRARGGRKANFGKAAQRLAQQRRQDQQQKEEQQPQKQKQKQKQKQGGSGGGSGNGGGSSTVEARKTNGSNIAHSRAHRSNTGVSKTHGHSRNSSVSSYHESGSASTNNMGHGASAASSEAPYDMDLPAYVHNNKQWMKFFTIFAQQSRERQKRQTLRHAG